jgi:BBSome-interacting protein 1
MSAPAPSQAAGPDAAASKPILQEVLPKAGLVYSEKGNLSEVLCKPKIMPIKSMTLEKLEQMEAQAARQGSIPATAHQ